MSIEDLPDDKYNYIRLAKLIKGCLRCRAELEKIGGIRLTLTEENDRDFRKLYQKYQCQH